MKKLFAIALTLVMLVACKGGTNGSSAAGSWLDGDRSSTTGDQTNAVNVVFFDLDSSKIDAEGQDKLQQQATMWAASKNKPMLQVEGHCDERGTVEYNLALGERRANAAKNYLVSQGVDASRINTLSYGKERPAFFGSDEKVFLKNRRAVTVIAN